jgi:hypothetical protein
LAPPRTESRVLIQPRNLGAALGLGALFAAPSHASELSYTFLDFRYVANDIDAVAEQTPVPTQTVTVNTEDGDGISVGGSVAIGERFYVVGSYQSAIIDVTGEVVNLLGITPVDDNFDFVVTSLGFGYQKELKPTLDLNAELTFDAADYDFGSFAGEDFDTHDSGVGAKAGVRWNPIEPLEVAGFVRWNPVGKPNLTEQRLDSDTLVGVGIGWYFIEDLGVAVNYEVGTVDTLTVSMRFSFGRLPF